MKRNQIMFYTEIHIKGKLNPSWSYWFEDMHIQVDACGDTALSGLLPDKSCVYGILSRLSSLGITLISVTCTEDTGGIKLKCQEE
jgi:hypothetical protein